MSISHLSDANFNDFVRRSGLSVVDFWASWCGPCVAFAPAFESAATKIEGVEFGKYEITDTNKTAASEHGVRSIPTVVAFKNGAAVAVKTGLMSEEALIEWIKELA